MKTLIAYDSPSGNTKKIAEAIGKGLGTGVTLLPVTKVRAEQLVDLDMFICGSPTHGGRPSPTMINFLAQLSPRALDGIAVAAFDTRFLAEEQAVWLRMLMKVIQYAAPRIAESLQAKGGKLIGKPEGFFVTGKEGPLKNGEETRATAWAKGLPRLLKK